VWNELRAPNPNASLRSNNNNDDNKAAIHTKITSQSGPRVSPLASPSYQVGGSNNLDPFSHWSN
jgi:hypothetical protein